MIGGKEWFYGDEVNIDFLWRLWIILTLSKLVGIDGANNNDFMACASRIIGGES